jgi:hypothetical protein
MDELGATMLLVCKRHWIPLSLLKPNLDECDVLFPFFHFFALFPSIFCGVWILAGLVFFFSELLNTVVVFL